MNDTSKTKSSLNNHTFRSMFLSEKIVNPKRDWKILIILFIILITASIGFDFYMYKQIVNGDMYISVTRTDLSIENLKSDDLQNILNNFENKKANMTALKLKNLVDPSI